MKKILLTIMVLLSASMASAQGFNQAEAYNSLYANMKQSLFPGTQTMSSNDLVRNLFQANNLASDEAYCTWYDPGIPSLNEAMPTANMWLVNDFWITLFWQIDQCNDFLEHATGTDATTQRQRAEARTLRALFYAYAIDLWGDVPLWTSTDSIRNNARIARRDVFNWIESELKDVLPTLDEPSQAAYGQVNKGVAQLLLARLFLNAEVYTGTGRWAEAKQQADILLSSGWYTLCPKYNYLFMGDNNKNGAQAEVVLPLEITPDMTENWGNTTYLIAATHSNDMPYYGLGQNWAGLIVRNNLLQKFDNSSDDRFLFYGEGRQDGSILGTDFTQGWSCIKYSNLRTDGGDSVASNMPDTDFPLMRLAEAYLIYAEADARMNGGSCTMDGLNKLNELRTRAHATPLRTANLETLADEWSREFYFEGRRRSDLVRFELYSSGNYQWTGRGYDVSDLYPIPAIVTSTYGMSQNPGYEDFSYIPKEVKLNTPAYQDTQIDLLRFLLLRFTWERPSDATTKLTYDLQVSLTDSAEFLPLLSTTFEDAAVVNQQLYNALKALGAQDDSELTAYIRISVHGVNSNVVPIKVKMTNPTQSAASGMWCLTGDNIADGTWSNQASALGTGMIPFYYNPDLPAYKIYTGYFNVGEFKIVKNYTWDEQFGSGELNGNSSWIQYGNGQNIVVNIPGIYSITLADNNAYVTYQNTEPQAYKTIYMPGSYNGWDASGNAMTPVTTVGGVENHDWQTVITFSTDTELKFAANGSWDANWGASEFPAGMGVQNGANIAVKAGTYRVLFNDITGYYMFLDAETGMLPSSGTGEDVKLTDGRYLNTDYATITATAAATIQSDKISGRVQVAVIPEDAGYGDLRLVINDKIVAYVAPDGTISEEDAKSLFYTSSLAASRTLTAQLRGIAYKNGLGVYTESNPFTITLVQEVSYVVDNTYYYIGGLTGWGTSTEMPMTKDAEGKFHIVFCLPANTDEWLKVMPSRAIAGGSVDWDQVVGAVENGASIGDGSLAIGSTSGAWRIINTAATEKAYTLTIDFNTMSYSLAEGDATGIALPIAGRQAVDHIYLLNGIRQSQAPSHGIFIRNGKKFAY